MKLIFSMQIKVYFISFLKVYFDTLGDTLGIKVSHKVDIIIVNGDDQAFSN